MRKTVSFLRTIALLLTLSAGVPSWGRPGYTRPLDVPQPDGTTVTLLMHGDEYMSYVTTADGYTVIMGDDGFYRYADRKGDGLVATTVVAHNPEGRQPAETAFLTGCDKHIHAAISTEALQRKETARRMCSPRYNNRQAPLRAAGIWDRIDYSNFKGLVVLVEFNDRQFTMSDPQAFYQRLTNERHLTDTSHTHYPVDLTGSTRDYFYDNSLGMFDPTFDVVGPVTIDYSCEYAAPKTADGRDDSGYNQRFVNIIRAVMNKVNPTVNLADYDLNNDGNIDMVYFIFAGYGSYVQGNNYKYIWPHASDMSGYSRYIGLRYDNKYFGRYACSVEIQDLEAYAAQHVWLDGIGTMCHEFSHVLGLADHYDTDYDDNGQAPHPDDWDVMAGGADFNYGLTPVGYSAFERHALGFTEPKVLDVAGQYELKAFDQANECYLLHTGTANDDFYLENRQQQGWDRFLPGHGLLVWRAETTLSSIWKNNEVNCNPDHMYLEVVKAMPEKALATAYTTFPGKGGIIDLTANGTPALRSWAGKEAVVDLYNITETADGIITFEAGKNLYPDLVENFESMALTTADAADQQGVFCQWTLKNATVTETADGKGEGSRMVTMKRSSTMQSSALPQPVRRLSLTVWADKYAAKLNVKYSVDGGATWLPLTDTNGQQQTSLSKNSTATLQFTQPIPAGAQLQIQMLATSTAAAVYVDNITVSLGNDVNSAIVTTTATAPTSAKGCYNLAGQRVDDAPNAKGSRLLISDGKKFVRK